MYRLFDKEKVSIKEYLQITAFGQIVVPIDFWSYLLENSYEELTELLDKFEELKTIGKIEEDAVDNDGVFIVVNSTSSIIPLPFYIFLQVQSLSFLKDKNDPIVTIESLIENTEMKK